jgi:hypothetical protein
MFQQVDRVGVQAGVQYILPIHTHACVDASAYECGGTIGFKLYRWKEQYIGNNEKGKHMRTSVLST